MIVKNMIAMTKLTIINKEGKIQNTEGQVQNNIIFIYDKSIAIDTGYTISYSFNNGINKNVVVTDPGYYGNVKGLGNAIPVYQCKVMDQDEYESKQKINNPINITNNNGNVFTGNFTNSPITINESFSELEKRINEEDNDCKEELLDLLEQLKEFCATMEETKTLPKSKSLMKKLSSHMKTHSWFYSEVVKLIGATIIKALG